MNTLATTVVAVLTTSLAPAEPSHMPREDSAWPTLATAIHSGAGLSTDKEDKQRCLQVAVSSVGSRDSVPELIAAVRASFDLGLSYEKQAAGADGDLRAAAATASQDAYRQAAVALAELNELIAKSNGKGYDTARVADARVVGRLASERWKKLIAGPDSRHHDTKGTDNEEAPLSGRREPMDSASERADPSSSSRDQVSQALACLRDSVSTNSRDKYALARAFHIVRLRELRGAPLSESDADVKLFKMLASAEDRNLEVDASGMEAHVDELVRAPPSDDRGRSQARSPLSHERSAGSPVEAGAPSDSQSRLKTGDSRGAWLLVGLGGAAIVGGTFQVAWGSTMDRITTREFADPHTPEQQTYLDNTIAPRQRLHWGLGSALLVTGIAAVTTGIVLHIRQRGHSGARRVGYRGPL